MKKGLKSLKKQSIFIMSLLESEKIVDLFQKILIIG